MGGFSVSAKLDCTLLWFQPLTGDFVVLSPELLVCLDAIGFFPTQPGLTDIIFPQSALGSRSNPSPRPCRRVRSAPGGALLLLLPKASCVIRTIQYRSPMESIACGKIRIKRRLQESCMNNAKKVVF